MKRKIKSKQLILVGFLASIIILGSVWQSIMVELQKTAYPAIGSYIDLGTYQLHYYSQGEGDVAFIFITGSGTPCAYTDFYELQNKLSTIGQTVTFDHAGCGWSTKTNSPRTIENLVNELSLLIDTACPNKQIVLLCHSLGSLEAISYTQRYPQKVKGIIFLDAGTPEFYSEYPEFFAKVMNRGTAFIRITGINRLLGELGTLLPLYGENIRNSSIHPDLKSLDKAMYYQHAGNSTTLGSIKLINENASKVLAGSSLDETPILILSSDDGNGWREVQIQLTSWSKNNRQVFVKDSQHYIYWSNYDVVSQNIEEFIQTILD